jgi:hypothetical protein
MNTKIEMISWKMVAKKEKKPEKCVPDRNRELEWLFNSL